MTPSKKKGELWPTQFCIADKVKLVKDCSWGKKGRECLIHGVSYLGNGDFEYDTTWGAWVDHEQLQLVHRATPGTFAQVDKDNKAEQDSYEGE